MICQRTGCGGTIVDGYCDECGLAPSAAGRNHTEVDGVAVRPATTQSSTRPRTTSTVATRRSRLGAGLVDIPRVPVGDPATAVMTDPTVAEHRRFCGRCDEPVGRSRDGRPGRTAGYCRACGAPFSFVARLAPGDVLASQYEVVGCLAHGGLGWIYLARDHNVSDRWVVLKGLLDSSDDHAMAAALAERRFLAEVEHPNIVKIHNFVEHGVDGYIVMEYINGVSLRGILETRRLANEGRPDPLPVEQAIAYCLEILPALGHLHELGLMYCDFKPDNVIQTHGSLKLIDLGGVYRIDDEASPVYGTAGYQAPEIAQTGPTVASDLFTVGRTLAVLCSDFVGYQTTYRYTLPAAPDVPLYTRFDSLYRFLERATAADPAERFQNADEMSSQLVGVLREVVSHNSGSPAPGPSTRFTPPGRAAMDAPDWWTLPTPLVDTDDPQAGVILALGAIDAEEIIHQLDPTRGVSVESDLWLVRALIDLRRLDEARDVLDGVDAADPWEWRAAWYRGVTELAAGRPAEAAAQLRRVYRTLPGELAPKLALGLAAEADGDLDGAAEWYEIVSRTDPSYTSAAFGLARCRTAKGDRSGAIEAYRRVLDTSSAHLDARAAEVRLLLENGSPPDGRLDDVRRAAAIVEHVPLDRERRERLTAHVYEAALAAVREGSLPDSSSTVLGRALTERELRLGLEQAYRALARHAATRAERVVLVDRANRVRPRSLL